MMLEKQRKQKKSSQKISASEQRREYERRKKEQEGFVHLEAIGWYCRRYHCRRKDDPQL